MDKVNNEVLSIVYSSSATVPFSSGDLVALLSTSRENNAGHEVTGMLLYHDERFLQVLEGPAPAVRERMALIAGDPRHTDVKILLEENLGERQFPDWTMGFEPYESSVSDDIPGYLASFGSADTDEQSNEAARALRQLLAWFEEQAKRS
ncbi:BLUF domain-containing protein [Herbiconiux liangxiaofengii]|uniref:BLUF domain-containing protein n=1 Tax=Herbiconiux liangxiaofengii TaxID=3342795 RepID=UPI0035BAE2AF